MSDIKEIISEYNEKALIADGFDGAIIGLVNQGGTSNFLVLYDSEKCIEILAKQFEEAEPGDTDFHTMAVEYFEYNVSGGYVGENTPMFLTRLE